MEHARAAGESPAVALSFDEGKGEIARDSAGNHDAAIHGAGWTEAGKYGSALEFDGEEDIVTIPDGKGLDFTEGFTLEAWVRPEATHAWADLFAKEDSETTYSFLLYAQNPSEFPAAYTKGAEAAEASLSGSESLPLNTWTHIALTSDGEHARLYVNGVLDETGSAVPLLASNGNLQIGGNKIWGEHFEGKVDEVRLYGEALGKSEIEKDRDTAIEPASTPKPVAALSFDEGKGEFARDSVGNHDGTIHGATWTEAGKYGSALEFDGEESIVTIPGNNNLDFTEGFTLEAWVRPEATHEWADLFAKEDSETTYSFLFYAQNPSEFPAAYMKGAEAAEAGISGSESLPLNTWTHIALTSDGERTRLYIDGELSETGSSVSLLTSDGDLQIGGNKIWGEHFEGKVDEIRLYGEAIGAGDITEDRDTAIEPAPAPNPVAALSFDEGKGEIARDSVGEHDGTIHGATWSEAGKYGSALHFDGENDIVAVPDSNDLDFTEGFTLEAWVRPEATHEWANLFTKEDSKTTYSFLAYAQNPSEIPSLYLKGAESATGGFNGPEPLPLNTWTHVAVTSDGQHSRLYINGELVETDSAVPLLASDGDLLIGGNEAWGEHFEGKIDEVRAYGEVLGAEEIQEDRNHPIEEPPPSALPSNISSNLTLTPAGGPYIGSTVTIDKGVTVTVKRGTVIKLDGTLYVNGSLNLNGTKSDPVFVTSLKDDSVGGDSNEDGSATHPEPGDWRDIEFSSSSTGIINYARIRYGGWSGTPGDYTTIAVKCPCANPPTITNSVITHNFYSGIYVVNGSPTITNNSITDNGGAGIAVETGGAPEINENTIAENGGMGISVSVGEGHHASVDINDNVVEENGETGIQVVAGTAYQEIDATSLGGNTVKDNSGKAIVYETYGTTNPEYHSNPTPPNITTNTVSGNAENGIWIAGAVKDSTTWEDNGYPLVVFNNGLTVSKEATLTLDPGLVIKNESRSIYVAGTLNAEGTAKDPVTLTSYRDDSVGGDTNGDGSASGPAPGDWAILEFVEDSGSPPVSSTLDHMKVLYGGLKIYPYTAMVDIRCPCANPPILTNSVFRHSASTAIFVVAGSPQITSNTVAENAGSGIEVVTSGSPEINENTISGNGGAGISVTVGEHHQARIDINDNLVEENSQGGIVVSAPISDEEIESASVGGNTVKDNSGKAIRYEAANTTNPEYRNNPTPPNITTNILGGNAENGIWIAGAVKESTAWEDNGYPLVVFNNGLTVEREATLTLDPGLVIKNESRSIYVAGTLNAEGTAKDPVTLTSYQDDSAGGDTNGDGSATHPEPGDWDTLEFMADEGGGSAGSALSYMRILYGGGRSYPFDPMIGVKCPCPHPPRFRTSLFAHAYDRGIYVGGDPGPTVDGKPVVSHSIFRDIPATAISKTGTATLSAPFNDFGCDSGPKPFGCGASVGEHIDPTPWANSPADDGQCQGQKTQCPKGADPVSLATGQLDYLHRDLLLTNKSKVPLEFTRAYNSGDKSDSGLGPGWSHTGLISASELESGDVLVNRQDGHQDVFTETEGGYEAPSGVSDTLVKNENGTFTLTTLHQAVYDFGETGRIATITDDHGLVTTYGYNENGRLATITDPSGQTLTFSYNETNHITKVTDSTGREVKFTYSETGELETATDALGGITKYGYDADQRLLTITDPRNHVILKNTYDGQGRIVEQLDGLENLWEIEYKPGETVVTQPEGGEITYGFDGEDRIISETNQDGHTTTIGYDGDGNVDRVEKPGGAVWELEYDSAGNLTSAVDPEEGERSFAYDAHNHIESYTDPRKETWEYEWSAGNDLKKVTDPAEGETTLTYNAAGKPLSITDPNEHTTEYEYDARGNRIAVVDPLEDETSFEYNSRNYLTAKAEPGLKPEEYGRDDLGDMLSKTTRKATRPNTNTTPTAW